MFNDYNIWAVVVGLIVIIAAEVGAIFLSRTKLGFGPRVWIAMGAGLLLGFAFQMFFPLKITANGGINQNPNFAGAVPSDNAAVKLLGNINSWVKIVTDGFVNMLFLMVVPLVAVSIITSLLRAGGSKDGGKKVGASAGIAIATLLITCAIAAFVGITLTTIMNLKASDLITNATSAAGGKSSSIQATIAGIFSARNIFAAFSENTILPVLFLSLILGIIFNTIRKDSPEVGEKIAGCMDILSEIVFGLVSIVLGLMPYTVLVFMLQMVATTPFASFFTLGGAIIAGIGGAAFMMLLHFLIVFLTGMNMRKYFKTCGRAIGTAFILRSSSATMPVTIETLIEAGVDETTASFAGSFGTCIGQNTCAGVYPAVLATMVFNSFSDGKSMFSDPMTLIMIILFLTIGSLGIAGVGGGNIAATTMLFGILGGNYADTGMKLLAVLISVDDLITFLNPMTNVTDSLTAGIVAARLTGGFNKNNEEPTPV